MSQREDILRDRYLLPGESEDGMYKRVANVLANDVFEEAKFYKLMKNKQFFPNSPTLVNAGTNRIGGFSACYVVPVEDSLDGIYKSMWHAGTIHKYYGGTGFNFSEVRPKGSLITSTGGKACGPISVLRSFNQTADMVRQGGKRQGANMGILNVNHPDILEFVNLKENWPDVTHFNISVGMSDAFMEDVQAEDYDKVWTTNETGYVKIRSNIVEYDPDNSDHNDKTPVKHNITVGQIWNAITEGAWRTGDPGVVFLDAIERGNTCKQLGRMVATNPCGEQCLLPYESCNLGSIDLSKFVHDGDFEYDAFGEVVHDAVLMLNRVIDKNVYPLPEVKEATLRTRKIGLGIMGWHDCLIKLGVPYCSEEALDICGYIGDRLSSSAEYTSSLLAKTEGVFPAWEGSEWDKMGIPVRNATQTTIAPTGTLSTVFAECSSGIEPHFARKFTRQSEVGMGTYEVVVPEGETAMEIPWEWHIKHQARWQKWIHNAASKTINMPTGATVEDVREAYLLAWKLGCKGVTVYRDGSKDKQVLRVIEHTPPGVGRERFGSTIEMATGCGNITVTCNDYQRRPDEVYVLSEGGCPANNEALGKVISKYIHDPRLRNGEFETVQRITRTLHKVKCTTAMKSKTACGKSCADIIAKRMDQVWADDKIIDQKPICPDCKRPLVFAGGCGNGECPYCGWSGCS